MANTKESAKETNKEKKSGFDAPAKFERVPKGYVMKKRKDGTITFVPPTKAGK